jgi:hypothetical protein
MENGILIGEIAIDDLKNGNRHYEFEKKFRAFLAEKGWPNAEIFPTRSWERLTGFSATVENGDETIRFLTIEPKDNIDKVVLVTKTVERKGDGGFVDIIKYQCQEQSAPASPFAALKEKWAEIHPKPKTGDVVWYRGHHSRKPYRVTVLEILPGDRAQIKFSNEAEDIVRDQYLFSSYKEALGDEPIRPPRQAVIQH